MKILITLFTVLSLLTCDKKEKISLDNDYFLIGTLSDYMGREKYKNVSERVDKYSQSERQLCCKLPQNPDSLKVDKKVIILNC